MVFHSIDSFAKDDSIIKHKPRFAIVTDFKNLAIHGAIEIGLFVLEENTAAIRTYKKIGFSFSEENITDMVIEKKPNLF